MNRTSLFARAAVTLAAVASSTLASADEGPASNQPRPQPARPALVSGVALDAGGRPIAGATAWLVTGEQNGFDPPLTAAADDSGRFEFPEVDERSLTGTGRRTATVIVRDKEGRIGWYQLPYNVSQRWRCEVRLREVADLHGQIVDADGQPIAAAHLVCESFAEPRAVDRPKSFTSFADLFPKLTSDYEVRSNADGTFALPRIPRGVIVNCRLSAAGMEEVRIALEAGEPTVVRLGKPGSIAGALEFPAEAEPKDTNVRLRISSQRNLKEDSGGLNLNYSHILTAAANGEFRFEGLPPGRYAIAPIAEQNVRWFGEATAPIEVRPGERVAGVTIPLEACQQVRGRVVDRDTGQGIEFVDLDIMSWGSRDSRQVATDADGRFTAWLRPGQVWVRVRQTPEKYVQPVGNAEPRSLRDGEWPTVQLSRAVTIEVLLVDESDKPVPLAVLDISVTGSRLNVNFLPTRADRTGRFLIGGIDGSDFLTLRARSADATTDGTISFTASEASSGVKLVMSPRFACRIRGQVVGPDGVAVPQARLALSTRRSVEMGGGRTASHTSRVDGLAAGADGSFESEALWAGGPWQLTIEADGYGPLTKELASSEGGKVYDLGPLVLQPMLTFRGQVVDLMGRPVPEAGLQVSLRAPSRPRSFAARSDSQGQFLFPVEPRDVVSVWAHSATAASDGAVVTLASRSHEPMTIVVSEESAFRLTCRAVDRDGQPVPNATVGLRWDRNTAPRGGGFGGRGFGSPRRGTSRSASSLLGDTPVGPDGTFRSGGLWPDEQYHLVVSAPGYQTVETAALAAPAGQTCDLGNLVLRRSGLSVEGRVLDSDGRPVSGATVINSGDAERPLSVLTTNDGRFKLDALFAGPVYLLVRKEGYRSAGARGAAGDDTFEVRLIDSKQPRQTSRGPEAKPNRADEQDFVRRWLSELWKLRRRVHAERSTSGQSSSEKPRMVKCMASLDLDTALAWSTAEGGGFDEEARLAAAERIVAEDLDQALMLADVPSYEAGQALRSMATQRMRAGDNDDALRLLRTALDPGKMGNVRNSASGEAELKADIGRMAMAAARAGVGPAVDRGRGGRHRTARKR